MENRRFLIIIGGGIAAYKSLELIRRLRETGAAVEAVLTRAGARFVTPLSVAGLTGTPVHDDLFDPQAETQMDHIQLSRAADLIVVAPATADLLAKMAAGLADDLATTLLLATDKPVLVAPAMNVRMWTHAATRRNVQQLQADGIAFVGPNEGEMACGEVGPGRMAEPAEIVAAMQALIGDGAPTADAAGGALSGRRVLVTAGPTHEPIDPVRYIANRSSGQQGYAIARALAAVGADVVLVSGPVALPDPPGVTVVRVETAAEMAAACEAALPVDIAICAAAVADWRLAAPHTKKLKKTAGTLPHLKFTENPDILKSLATRPHDRPELVIGFAAETEQVEANARKKRIAKGCDWILANDVSPETGIMGGRHNTIHFITEKDTETWPSMTKEAVGTTLAARIAAHFTPPNVTQASFGGRRRARKGS